MFSKSHSDMSTTMVLCGDFNMNLLHVDHNPVVSSFIDSKYINTLFPTIHWPTRITPSTATLIDNIFCNSPSVLHSSIILSDISDHFPIFTVLDVKLVTPDKAGSALPQTSKLGRNFCLNNINKFAATLSDTTWDFITDDSYINENYSSFLLKFRQSFEGCFPKQNVLTNKKSSNLWMTSGLIKSSHVEFSLYSIR